VLVLDQLYIVDGCESVSNGRPLSRDESVYCQECAFEPQVILHIRTNTVIDTLSQLIRLWVAWQVLTLGLAPTNCAVTVSPALYGLLPTSTGLGRNAFQTCGLSTITGF